MKLSTLAACMMASAIAVEAQSTSTALFRALASPSHENPPIVGSQSSGEVLIEMRLDRDAAGNLTQAVVDFRVNYNFPVTETVRAFHIHRGAPGVNGPVVVDPRFGPPVDLTGSGTLFRNVVITDPVGLETIRAILARPSDFYFNLHTASAPGGLIRGQLAPGDPASEALRALAGKIDALTAKVDALGADVTKIGDLQAQIALVRQMLRDIGRVLYLVFP
jgi:hypothetical protein